MDVLWILLLVAVAIVLCAVLAVVVQRRRRSGTVLSVDAPGPRSKGGRP